MAMGYWLSYAVPIGFSLNADTAVRGMQSWQHIVC